MAQWRFFATILWLWQSVGGTRDEGAICKKFSGVKEFRFETSSIYFTITIYVNCQWLVEASSTKVPLASRWVAAKQLLGLEIPQAIILSRILNRVERCGGSAWLIVLLFNQLSIPHKVLVRIWYKILGNNWLAKLSEITSITRKIFFNISSKIKNYFAISCIYSSRWYLSFRWLISWWISFVF